MPAASSASLSSRFNSGMVFLFKCTHFCELYIFSAFLSSASASLSRALASFSACRTSGSMVFVSVAESSPEPCCSPWPEDEACVPGPNWAGPELEISGPAWNVSEFGVPGPDSEVPEFGIPEPDWKVPAFGIPASPSWEGCEFPTSPSELLAPLALGSLGSLGSGTWRAAADGLRLLSRCRCSCRCLATFARSFFNETEVVGLPAALMTPSTASPRGGGD
mmetsp:Transcript_45213/g.97570  ORF Transcript_45213/g.97570 Transcript_45213/m.97570 type:complete len:220 (+) Transcript_45213:1429-2088(+)